MAGRAAPVRGGPTENRSRSGNRLHAVVAEGMETEAQRVFLACETCEEIQGYRIGRPEPIEGYLDIIGISVERRRNA